MIRSPDQYPCLVLGLLYLEQEKKSWALAFLNYRSSINIANIQPRKRDCVTQLLFLSFPHKLVLSISHKIIGSCVFCATLDRYIGRHIDRRIGRVSVDISTDARPICRSICRPTLGRYVGRDVSVDILTDISTEISAEISADTRPICRPRVVVRQSAGMSIDRLPTFRRYLTATCVHSTGDCSLSRRHNLTLVSDFC